MQARTAQRARPHGPGLSANGLGYRSPGQNNPEGCTATRRLLKIVIWSRTLGCRGPGRNRSTAIRHKNIGGELSEREAVALLLPRVEPVLPFSVRPERPRALGG